MKNIKRILITLSFFMILALLMGAVSAESLNLTETELASEGVKNYTEVHGNIPGYVEVSDKNSTAPSFLKTITKTTVQLNSGSTAPVTISSVNNPTGPSGSTSGNLYKSEYVTVANNVYNYINTNGRAPNYASSSLGNIRYESLVYAYSKIINFYRLNGRLPDYVSVSNIVGIDSTGVVIDNVPPIVSNNLASGSYNTSKNVTLTANDNHDPNPLVYYSTDNGATWDNHVKTITLNLNPGVTNLKYYARDAAGNTGVTQTVTYTIDTTAPTVTIDIAGGVYNTTKIVTLNATDNFDTNPTVYYSLNNGTTWNNQSKTVTLNINPGVTYLKYYSRDAAGNTCPIQTEIYTIDTTAPTVTISDPNQNAVNVPADKIITITFSKPIQAGSLWIELKNSAGTAIPINTTINDNVLTIIPTNLLIANRYMLTLHTGSVTDLVGNPLALWAINFNSSNIFTVDSIINAASTVKSYIDANHVLPSTITISGISVDMPQFLELSTTAVLNINNNSNANIPVGSYDAAISPSENITTRDINKTDYLDIANRVKLYIETNGRAPNYATQNSTGSTIRYESLVYMYAQILNFYNLNGTLPDYVTVNPWVNASNSTVIGNTTYGYVEKEFYGNLNSNQTIVLIIGVHPQENGIHNAIYNALVNKSINLSKRYVIYKVHVTQNADNYSIGRMNGQLLAQAFIVPDVSSENPILVLDNHENHGANSGYDYYRFLYLISNTTITTTYANEIISQIPFLVIYSPPNPTSTQYVTVPIANQGITTIIYETYFYDTETKKTSDANAIIDALDDLGNETNEPINPENPNVIANPTGGSFNTTQTVNLTKADPNSNATIYYTIDGSEPQTSSTKIEYTAPIVINTTTTLKYAIVDSEGNWSSIYSATYIIDLIAPTISSADPVNNAMKVPSDKVIKITFNEPIKAGSLYIELKNSSGTVMPITTFINGNILTITPTNLLTANRYNLTLHAGSITDLAGNPLALWGISFNTTNVFTLDSITDAAETVKKHVETNHNLPSNVNIAGTTVSMPQFLKLSMEALLNIAGTMDTSLILGTYGSAPSPAETMKTGIINSTEFRDIANRVNSFMNSNGRAPNYVSSSLGNIRYESIVYLYSRILNSYGINEILPGFIVADPWSVVSNTNTKFYSEDQINDAASRVKSFIESNHRLPSYVTISGRDVSMPSFLKLATTTLLNIEGGFYTSIVLQSCEAATNPEENITNKNMGLVEYVHVASNVRTFMDADVFGRAPNYATTSFGNMRYESLVYLYAQLLNYYNSTGYLPANVTVTPWSIISNTNTVFFTKDQVNSAAITVKNYIETNHALPSSVNIAGKQINMPQFLQLSTDSLLSITGTLCTSFNSRSYGTATNPSENVTNKNIGLLEYMDFANRVNSFMDANGRAPNYVTQNSTGSTIRYESLVYMYAQILSSYNATNATLPNYITVNPWSIVINPNTAFLSMDHINNASGNLKSYIESNHTLPSSITISGKQVTMPQFLKLATSSLLNIENDLNTSIVLESVGNAVNSTEDIASGDISYLEYMEIAKYAKNYMNSNETAPDYAYQTSLGTHMGFESLVYMYSDILNLYYTNNETLPSNVTVTPWIAVLNPNAIYNYQSGKSFSSIQAAIDDVDTKGGDYIGIGTGTILENVIINKKLTIMSIPTVEVTIQAADPNLPVFTITTSGSGSIIQDLIIKGSTNNAGIYINESYYNTISGNIICNNSNGIYIYNSTDNQIADSEISNNTMNGVLINVGSNNDIAGNILVNNGQNGVSINESNNDTISNNIIRGNVDGIHLNNSSSQINFNRITDNSRYGLYNEGNGTVNAQNNWWGSNNPNISLNSTSDIAINGGIVNCDQWLILNITSSTDRFNRAGATYNYIISADLTHNNQGKDTSSGNSDVPVGLPDGIPVNFTTTFGTINTQISTRNGKSVALLNSTVAGSANVTVTLDNQIITIPVNITNANIMGIYNNRTGEGFFTIQSAIDSNNTLNGDTITIADGTYKENVVVYKTLTIKPVSGANITIYAADPSKGVFTIVKEGSTIQNLNIMGAVDSYGLFLYANNINLIGNSISANYYGISLFNSNSNLISENTITNNWYGINLVNSNSNTFSNNTIIDNWYGINLINSTSTSVSKNNVTSNWYGIVSTKSNSTTLSENIITDNYSGISISNSDSTTIFGNTITNNGGGICYYKSNNTIISENIVINNEIADISQIDTTGIVMQNNIWNCGPASLATVLNNLGINTTQEELATLAGTDKDGTSMYGLVHAAQVKGLNAAGMILSVDQLKPGYIVLLDMNGLYHFSVIKNIDSTTVYLADSVFGNINMTQDDFTAMFSGYVLIITNNSTSNSTNSTVNGTDLTNEQMQNIKGTNTAVATGGAALCIAAGPIGWVILGGAITGIAIYYFVIDPYLKSKRNSSSRSNTNYPNSNIRGHKLSPGYYPGTRTYTRTRSPGNKYMPGIGYISHSGYVPTSNINQINLQYQRDYENYLNKKASEWNKISDTAKIISDNELRDRQAQWYRQEILKLQEVSQYLQGISGGDGDDPYDEVGKMINSLSRDAGKRLSRASAKYRSGNTIGATTDVLIAVAEIHTAVTLRIAYP